MTSSRKSAPHLPVDILILIFHRLVDIPDLLRCRAVASSWLTAADSILNSPHLQPSSIWLAFRLSAAANAVCFFSLSEKRLYRIPLPVGDLSLVGSSHGWLITVGPIDADSYDVVLVNPITSEYFSLPPLRRTGSARPGQTKGLLSSSPHGDGCIVVLYDSNFISFIRVGDESWHSKDTGQKLHLDCKFHEGDLFALMQDGRIVIWNFHGLPWKPTDRVNIMFPVQDALHSCNYRFLVSHPNGDLLVVRERRRGPQFPRQLSVLKLKHEISRPELVMIKKMEGQVLLLGCNQSAFLAEKSSGMLLNCVYFFRNQVDWLDGNEECKKMDAVVFNLVDRTVMPLIPESLQPIGSPVWFSLSFT